MEYSSKEERDRDFARYIKSLDEAEKAALFSVLEGLSILANKKDGSHSPSSVDSA